jgi:hypothetical protein
MFNVLNKFISRLDSDLAPQPSTQSASDSSYGFQVLRNTNKDLPIEPWFDFIIGINGHFIVRVESLGFLESNADELPGKPRCQPLCDRSPELRRFISIARPLERKGTPCPTHMLRKLIDDFSGPAYTCSDHSRPSTARVFGSELAALPPQFDAEHLAHPDHPISTLSRTPYWPSSTQ